MAKTIIILPLFLLIGIGIAVVLGGLLSVAPVSTDLTANVMTDAELLNLYPEPALAMTQNEVSRHGITKHVEAKAIQDSCNKGVFQVWRDRREKKYYYICKLANDTWGIIPVVISAGEEIWKTAFSPGSGCWADVIRYLSGYATRYNGIVK